MTMFATLDQLAIRLGKTDASEFTAAQAAQGELLLVLATGLIAHAVDETAAWAEALDPVPDPLVSTCLDVCIRAINNLPAGGGGGVSSETETLGAYSHTTRYGSSDSSGGGAADPTALALTPAEERRVRRAVLGTSTSSPDVSGIFESTFDAELLA